MSLWTSAEAVAATGGRTPVAWTATGVSIDTRTLQPGDLFVALKAARDGHDFVAQALAAGAAAALVSHVPEGVDANAPLLVVDDVQRGLEALGQAGRARTDARVVAITGSVGKTSTKEMLRAILGDQGKVHASVASYNNHWGVPLTLARMPQETEFAVIEIGMNHPGEIAPLACMARPHVAMITTVAAAHLEAFDNIEGIAVEKASILDGLEPGGTAVINTDCSTAGVLRDRATASAETVIGFGTEADADVFHLSSIVLHDAATVVQADVRGAPLVFKLAVPGRHFAMNGLGALASAEALGADLALAVQSLGRWTPYQGRGVREQIVLDPIEPDMVLELIDDSYNANPTSMGAALEVLAAARTGRQAGQAGHGRRIAIMGDMKELGPTENSLHESLASLPSMEAVDVVHAVGPLMQALYAALPPSKRGLWTETAAELAEALPRKLGQGDVVLVKGSLSMQLARVVDTIRKMGHPAPPSNET